jgi:hypothetical protein
MPGQQKMPRRALLVSVTKTDDESMRISMDDVLRSDVEGTTWKLDCHVTSKVYDENAFDDQTLDEKELADFGYYILSRLCAFKKRDEL